MEFIDKIPKHVGVKLQKISKYLSKYTKRAYVVGGCVRDMLLGSEIKDIDIEVYDIEPSKFEKIMEDFGALGVGKSFFVYKWGEIDISLPRVEKKVSLGHRGFRVSLSQDKKEASSRRDFTMNSLMIDLFTGELFDFWGGAEDIQNKTIKIVDENSFKDDSLRVLRAMQFSSRLGFKIDPNSLQIMQKMSLDDLSEERIFWEFEKMFLSKNLHYGLYYMFKLCIAKKIFGIEIDKDILIKTSLEMTRNSHKFEREYYRYYFLYILAKNLELSFDMIFDRLGFPRKYINILKKQKFQDRDISDIFLVKLSLEYPIKEWLGNYIGDVQKRAKELDVYDRMYDGNIFAEDIIKDGYEGKEIGIMLKKRRIQKAKKWVCSKKV